MKFEIEKAVEVLSNTPLSVRSLLSGLSVGWTRGESSENDWNPYDIIGHYIHGEKTDWIPRAKIILGQGVDITFVPFDRFAQFEDSKGKTLDDLLDEFADLREQNLKTLEEMSLTDEQLQLKGIHPELGEVTLEQLLSTWVVHDLTHIRQIATVLAKKYDGNVGPWRGYLSILQ